MKVLVRLGRVWYSCE